MRATAVNSVRPRLRDVPFSVPSVTPVSSDQIRPARAISSVVRIRSTCWEVNMNMASSST
ncbi:hypothetical protein BH24ACI4_BH24ACI4_16600 [soil metagenome]